MNISSRNDLFFLMGSLPFSTMKTFLLSQTKDDMVLLLDIERRLMFLQLRFVNVFRAADLARFMLGFLPVQDRCSMARVNKQFSKLFMSWSLYLCSPKPVAFNKRTPKSGSVVCSQYTMCCTSLSLGFACAWERTEGSSSLLISKSK